MLPYTDRLAALLFLLAAAAMSLVGICFAAHAVNRQVDTWLRQHPPPWDDPVPEIAPTTWEDSVKRRAVKADEYDVVTGYRKYLCYMQRAGVVSRIKRRMRRRERHTAKHRTRRGEDQ